MSDTNDKGELGLEGEQPAPINTNASHLAPLAEYVHKYLGDSIRHADHKTEILLLLSTALLVLILQSSDIQPGFSSLPTTTKLLLAVAICGLGWSVISAVAVLWPRLPTGSDGFLFWENIKKHGSPSAYIERIAYLDNASVIKEFSTENFILASIVAKKFRVFRQALTGAVIGYAFGITFLLIR